MSLRDCLALGGEDMTSQGSSVPLRLRSSEETLLQVHPFSGPYSPDCETEQDTNSRGTSPPSTHTSMRVV